MKKLALELYLALDYQWSELCHCISYFKAGGQLWAALGGVTLSRHSYEPSNAKENITREHQLFVLQWFTGD